MDEGLNIILFVNTYKHIACDNTKLMKIIVSAQSSCWTTVCYQSANVLMGLAGDIYGPCWLRCSQGL